MTCRTIRVSSVPSHPVPHRILYVFISCHQHRATAKQFPNNPFLGTRTVGADGKAGAFAFQSYATVKTRVDHFAAGLAAFGLVPGDKIALYSQNRADWLIAEQAAFCHSLVTVPLYETLGPDAAQYVLVHGECRACVCTLDKVGTLTALIAAGKLPLLQLIVVMPLQAFDKAPAKGAVAYDKVSEIKSAATIMTMAALEAKGKATPSPHRPPQPSDLSTLCYTSGTTGMRSNH